LSAPSLVVWLLGICPSTILLKQCYNKYIKIKKVVVIGVASKLDKISESASGSLFLYLKPQVQNLIKIGSI